MTLIMLISLGLLARLIGITLSSIFRLVSAMLEILDKLMMYERCTLTKSVLARRSPMRLRVSGWCAILRWS